MPRGRLGHAAYLAVSSAGDEVAVGVEGDRDGVDDLEGVDALGFEVAEPDQHPRAVALLHQRSREQVGLLRERSGRVDVPGPEWPGTGHRPRAVLTGAGLPLVGH